MRYNSLNRKGLIDIEKEIISLYDTGVQIKQIGKKLNIGRSTVHIYLKKNNRRRCIRHTFDDSSFSNFTPENCYWAGFIAADGCINKTKTAVRVNLNIKDKLHLVKLLKFTKDENISITEGIRVISFNKKEYTINHCYADINSVKIVKDLCDNFNIVPAKSFILEPPNKIPDHLIRDYIRGYFDGDGSIYWNKSHKTVTFNICSGSGNLLKWISNNIKDQVNYNFSEKALCLRKNGSIYYISQNYNSAKLILDWMYSSSTTEIRLDRKYDRYLSYKN